MNRRSAALLVSLIASQAFYLVYADSQHGHTLEATSTVSSVKPPGGDNSAKDAANEAPKPSEAEAMAAAVAYLNRGGELKVEKTEFITWGTYSEQYTYWPMKFRMTYKRADSDKSRKNDYAVKVFQNPKGEWQASQYYAWRTDFN